MRQALADSLPLDRRDGGFVRAGYDAALDALRALRDESRGVIAALQARYSDLTGTKQLKLKHNHFLGYFVEVPQAQVPAGPFGGACSPSAPPPSSPAVASAVPGTASSDEPWPALLAMARDFGFPTAN